MKRVITVTILVVSSSPLGASKADLVDHLVGCYRAGQHELLATWHPEGGLALADLLAARVVRFERAGAVEARWIQASSSAEDATEVRFEGIGTASGTLTWYQPGAEEGRVYVRVDCGYHQQEVTVSSSEVELGGLLLLPDSDQPHPGVVFIHGSGDSDRVGASYLRAADHLASLGIAVLIPDKRGVGRSAGDWRRATLQDLAADANAAVLALASRPGVAADHVGVLAVSQGGWVAPEAARTSPAINFVVVLSGAAVSFGNQQRHVLANLARRLELSTEHTEELLRLYRLAERFMLEGAGWEAYEKARSQALAEPLAPVAQSFPAASTAWEWSWGRSFWTFDPQQAWNEVETPVLMLFGEEDEHDSIPVQASLDTLRETIPPKRKAPFDVHVFPGMGHALAESGERHLSARVLWLISNWIEEQTVRKELSFSLVCEDRCVLPESRARTTGADQ